MKGVFPLKEVVPQKKVFSVKYLKEIMFILGFISAIFVPTFWYLSETLRDIAFLIIAIEGIVLPMVISRLFGRKTMYGNLDYGLIFLGGCLLGYTVGYLTIMFS